MTNGTQRRVIDGPAVEAALDGLGDRDGVRERAQRFSVLADR
ncbi:hypothetical protein [Amycolatopsis deserti]|nr:hypothetical protein [Amycolatopsis deserti]